VNRTPYRAVIAELMLRRTRADQVVPVYENFLRRYPDLASAAAAEAGELRELLYPLGLAWRADSIVAFLKEAYLRFGNALPGDGATLMTLPGVGDYVAAAVQCFTDHGTATLVDVNVVRVIGRVYGLNTSGEARRRRAMREKAAALVDPDEAAAYHYALLDFSARVCTAARPKCASCPFGRRQACTFYLAVLNVSQPAVDPRGPA
jgi:A/G-specific adenine glycosylase